MHQHNCTNPDISDFYVYKFTAENGINLLICVINHQPFLSREYSAVQCRLPTDPHHCYTIQHSNRLS